MTDPAPGPISSALAARPELLHESWQAAIAAFSHKLSDLFARPEVYRLAERLLRELVRLVEGPEGLDPSAPPDLEPVLAEIRALQAEPDVGTTELVLCLFLIKDVLYGALGPVDRGDTDPVGMARRAAALGQLSTLLNRLGLVLFETDVRAREQVGFYPDALAIEYSLLYERARRLAITDQLTGLHNFGYFLDRLKEERARAERYQRLLSLILFDLDHFKRYNDRYGHPAGNEVLRTVADILRKCSRHGDIVARYGGEELVVLLPETTRREATEVAERIRRMVEGTEFVIDPARPPARITVSAGVATYPVDAADEEELVRHADQSLYRAKRGGRNRTVAHQPAHHERLVFRPPRPVETVALVGNFNNWNKDADFMHPVGNGEYEFVIALNPGVYQYKFVLDGVEWVTDPSCPERCPDGMGGENSVLRIARHEVRPGPVGPDR